jgi:hypothetical protein
LFHFLHIYCTHEFVRHSISWETKLTEYNRTLFAYCNLSLGFPPKINFKWLKSRIKYF